MEITDFSLYNKEGLRIHCRCNNQDVCNCIKRFAKWIRSQYHFPVRINVYLLPQAFVYARDGDKCVSTYWFPKPDTGKYPYFRIATGGYEERLKKWGRDDALASDILLLCKGVIQYWQWLDTGDIYEKGVRRQSNALLRLYETTVDHP